MRRRALRFIACMLLSTAIPAASLFGQDSEATKNLVRSTTQFAVDLYRKLEASSGNILFSPYSISTVGILAYRGARGETARQLAATLHTPPDGGMFAAYAGLQSLLNAIRGKGGVELSIANSFWPQETHPFLKEYLDFAGTFPQTEIVPADFRKNPEAVRSRVNRWVEQNTGSRIGNLLSQPLNPLTRLLVVNAIFFKGAWLKKFRKASTTEAPFYLQTGESVQVLMMKQGSKFNYRQDQLVQVLELPYTGNDLSMVILLPSLRDGLRTLEGALTTDTLEEWTTFEHTSEVNILLPKFSLRQGLQLAGTLKALGVVDAFDPKRADFSGMDGMSGWLYLKDVLHEAFVAVDEEGTEATAATVGVGCFPAGTDVLTVDGPRAIEKVNAGTRVFTCDPQSGAWTLAMVRGRQAIAYEGDVFSIRAGAVSLWATGNHPFFVLSGDRLSSRPEPRDVPTGEPITTDRGRWVEARDLEVGDVLDAKQGGQTVITGMSSRHEKVDVYNLEIEDSHTYAVHRRGILVHNKAGAEPLRFVADHPFLFLIRETSTGSILFMGRVSDPTGAAAPALS